MDLFEYQGKQYFARYDIPVSPGGPADTVDEAVKEANQAGYPVVVKAQVQVGGRGKAGGIKLAANVDEVRTVGEQPQRVIDGGGDVGQTPAVGERVRRAVDDPHHRRPPTGPQSTEPSAPGPVLDLGGFRPHAVSLASSDAPSAGSSSPSGAAAASSGVGAADSLTALDCGWNRCFCSRWATRTKRGAGNPARN